MKKRFTILTAALALLAILAIPMGMKGQTSVTWPGTTALPGTATAVANDQNVTIMVSSTNTYTAPIRIYANTTVTINALNGAKILSVAYEASSTGNYVTNAQNATVTPNVTPTVSDKIVTWTYAESDNVTEFTFKPSAQTRSNGITITYIISGATPTCATPTFSPVAGTYTQAQNVSISCTTEGATIYYTTNGDNPTTNSTVYTEAISVSSNMTIKAMATASGYDNSSVATAEYAFITLDHAGTLEDPYTVADARAAINANAGTQGVYATGIVSAIPTAYSSDYSNITFNMVDETGDEVFLQAYRCGGDEAANVTVGDVAVVYGNLTKYGSTYEFGQGCQLVSLTHPVVTVEAPTFNPVAGTYAETQTVTISCATQGVDIYYTLDGTDPDMNSTMYEDALTVSETTTIKAVAYDGNDNASTVATATYHINSQANPYTVAQALAFNEYPANGIYVHGIVSTAPTQTPTNNGELTYYISDNGEATAQLEVYKGKGLGQAAFTAQDDIQVGDIVTIYGNVQVYNGTIEFGSGNYLVEFERPASAVPSITITNATVSVPAEGGEGTLTVTYENITEVVAEVYFCNVDGETATYEWITADINTDNNVEYLVEANEGEARTAYFKVWAYDDELNEVYSNLVTVTQAEYVAPVLDYAELPFEWEGGSSADFLALNGTSANGLGSDYASNNAPYLIKFDGNGDYIQVKTDSRPGFVTIGVKMIGGSATSTITVQGSSDGESFTDIQVLTISGAQNSELTLETTGFFAENDRYVRLYFTKGSNVGVGPITIAQYAEPAHAITVDPDLIEIGAEGGEGGFDYKVNWSDGGWAEGFQFYDANEETIDQPDWIAIVFQVGEHEDYHYTIAANEGEARTAYFKAYTDDEGTTIYSNLVTVSQAGAPQPSITVAPVTVNVPATGENGYTLETLTITYENIVVENYESFTIQFYDVDGEETESPSWVVAGVTGSNDEGYTVRCVVINNNGEARTTYFKVFSGETCSELVTVSQAAYVAPPTPGTWVLTSLEDLTENDIFVIVGTDADNDATYALPNDVTGSAPLATSITVADGTLSEEPAANLQWNVSGNATDGYTFYVNGDHDNWLFCNTNNATGSNNNMRVGSGGNVNRNVFILNEDGYLITNDDKAVRYLSIYFNSGVAQDWRGYVNTTNGALPISFYKKVETSTEPYTLTIPGYGNSTGGYRLIASPLVEDVLPSEINEMTSGEYDLYRFNQANVKEWENYKQDNFALENGKGYLYAHSTTITLSFTGTPYEDNVFDVELSKTEGATLSGWNLVGNPFDKMAYIADGRDFYTMNADGSALMAATNNSIEAMEGIFVLASEDGESMTFTTEEPQNPQKGIVALNLSQGRGVIDRAIVRFGEGRELPKFQLFENTSSLSFKQGNNDYAVVSSQGFGEMQVSFKAANNGIYTLNLSTENVEFSYLHLIDNMTGADIDLLANPSYSFEAKNGDYTSRFKLVFATGNNSESNEFAYISDGNIIVNGEGTLQVIDMSGRIVSTSQINGMSNVNVNAAGVYVLQLTNGENVKTQKIVVK